MEERNAEETSSSGIPLKKRQIVNDLTGDAEVIDITGIRDYKDCNEATSIHEPGTSFDAMAPGIASGDSSRWQSMTSAAEAGQSVLDEGFITPDEIFSTTSSEIDLDQYITVLNDVGSECDDIFDVTTRVATFDETVLGDSSQYSSQWRNTVDTADQSGPEEVILGSDDDSDEPTTSSCLPPDLDDIMCEQVETSEDFASSLRQKLEEPTTSSCLPPDLDDIICEQVETSGDFASSLRQKLEEPTTSSCLPPDLDDIICEQVETSGDIASSLRQKLEEPTTSSCLPPDLDDIICEQVESSEDFASSLRQKLEELQVKPEDSFCVGNTSQECFTKDDVNDKEGKRDNEEWKAEEEEAAGADYDYTVDRCEEEKIFMSAIGVYKKVSPEGIGGVLEPSHNETVNTSQEFCTEDDANDTEENREDDGVEEREEKGEERRGDHSYVADQPGQDRLSMEALDVFKEVSPEGNGGVVKPSQNETVDTSQESSEEDDGNGKGGNSDDDDPKGREEKKEEGKGDDDYAVDQPPEQDILETLDVFKEVSPEGNGGVVDPSQNEAVNTKSSKEDDDNDKVENSDDGGLKEREKEDEGRGGDDYIVDQPPGQERFSTGTPDVFKEILPTSVEIPQDADVRYTVGSLGVQLGALESKQISSEPAHSSSPSSCIPAPLDSGNSVSSATQKRRRFTQEAAQDDNTQPKNTRKRVRFMLEAAHDANTPRKDTRKRVRFMLEAAHDANTPRKDTRKRVRFTRKAAHDANTQRKDTRKRVRFTRKAAHDANTQRKDTRKRVRFTRKAAHDANTQRKDTRKRVRFTRKAAHDANTQRKDTRKRVRFTREAAHDANTQRKDTRKRVRFTREAAHDANTQRKVTRKRLRFTREAAHDANTQRKDEEEMIKRQCKIYGVKNLSIRILLTSYYHWSGLTINVTERSLKLISGAIQLKINDKFEFDDLVLLVSFLSSAVTIEQIASAYKISTSVVMSRLGATLRQTPSLSENAKLYIPSSQFEEDRIVVGFEKKGSLPGVLGVLGTACLPCSDGTEITVLAVFDSQHFVRYFTILENSDRINEVITKSSSIGIRLKENHPKGYTFISGCQIPPMPQLRTTDLDQKYRKWSDDYFRISFRAIALRFPRLALLDSNCLEILKAAIVLHNLCIDTKDSPVNFDDVDASYDYAVVPVQRRLKSRARGPSDGPSTSDG